MVKREFAEYSIKKVVLTNIVTGVVFFILGIIAINIASVSNVAEKTASETFIGVVAIMLFGLFLLPVTSGVVGGIIALFIKPFKRGIDNLKLYIVLIGINLVNGFVYFKVTGSVILFSLYIIFSLGGPLIVATLKHSRIKLSEAEN